MADEAKTGERVDGPTPNGGVYSVANFLDARGRPCPKAEAAGMEIGEFDGEDRCVGRTYLARADDGPPPSDAWLGEDAAVGGVIDPDA